MKSRNSSGMVFAMVAAGLLLASCASTPTAKAPPAPPTPAQTAALAEAAAAGRPEFPGFTLTVRRGQELYCQKRSPTGSRVRVVEACHTRDEMLKMAQNNDEFFKQAGSQGSHDALRTDSPN